MNRPANDNALTAHETAADSFRGALAYAALALGAAANAGLLPLIAWGLALRGFR